MSQAFDIDSTFRLNSGFEIPLLGYGVGRAFVVLRKLYANVIH